MQEDVGIAVGIDASAPGQHEGLVLAGLGLLRSEVANSVTQIFMSNPVSEAIDWITCETASVSAPFGTIRSTLTGGVTPASFNSALALATSRARTG